MFQFLIICFFITISKADVIPCTGASNHKSVNFDIYWCISSDQRKVIFTINASMFNYFGIAYTPTMTNANYTIVDTINNTVNVATYWTQRHQRPILSENYTGFQLIGTQTDNSTYITIKYSLPLSSPNMIPNFIANQTLNFSLAWRNTSTISNHGRENKQYFSGKLWNGSIVDPNSMNVKPPPSSLVLGHGIILTILWCLIADVALFIITYRYRVYAYILHITLMMIVLIGNLIVVIMMLRKSNNLNDFKDLDRNQKAHLVIGIMILCWFAIQLFTGFIVRILQVFTVTHPRWIKLFSWLHIISGWIMMILAKVNILIGWRLTELQVPFYLLLGWNILFIVLYIIRKVSQIFTKYKGYKNIPTYVKVNQFPLTPLQNLVNTKPYNHPSLLPFNYMIFADYVYNTQKFRFVHPGGRYIMDELRGRQVDRFIYGMYGPQSLAKFTPFEHSQHIFRALGPPEFKLYQPIQNGSLIKRQGNYILSNIQMYSKDIFAVYFSSNNQVSSAIPSPGFQYLGQYYTLTAYNKTRLYTRVQCLMPQNKNIQLKILHSLGYKSNFNSNFISTPGQTSFGINIIPSQRNIISNQIRPYSVAFLIKRYNNGAFTSKLLPYSNQIVQISPPMGRGLDIDKIQPGRIVLFAGGTGIFPFMDLIDILFKTIAIQDSHIQQNQIYNVAPVLKLYNLLQLFSFDFFVALQNISDIHPVHFDMIQYIASSRPHLINFTFKIKTTVPLTPIPGISFIQQRFNTKYLNGLNLTMPIVSMIYMCGPPLMNSQLLQSFKNLSVNRQKVFIL